MNEFFFIRAFVYLSHLLYGFPLEQTVPIVSDRAQIRGHLTILVEQLPDLNSNESTDEHLRTYRNVSSVKILNFDDKIYFQVKRNDSFFFPFECFFKFRIIRI